MERQHLMILGLECRGANPSEFAVLFYRRVEELQIYDQVRNTTVFSFSIEPGCFGWQLRAIKLSMVNYVLWKKHSPRLSVGAVWEAIDKSWCRDHYALCKICRCDISSS